MLGSSRPGEPDCVACPAVGGIRVDEVGVDGRRYSGGAGQTVRGGRLGRCAVRRGQADVGAGEVGHVIVVDVQGQPDGGVVLHVERRGDDVAVNVVALVREDAGPGIAVPREDAG